MESNGKFLGQNLILVVHIIGTLFITFRYILLTSADLITLWTYTYYTYYCKYKTDYVPPHFAFFTTVAVTQIIQLFPQLWHGF